MRTQPMNFVFISFILIIWWKLFEKKMKECTNLYWTNHIPIQKWARSIFMTPLFYMCIHDSLYHNIRKIFSRTVLCAMIRVICWIETKLDLYYKILKVCVFLMSEHSHERTMSTYPTQVTRGTSVIRLALVKISPSCPPLTGA